MKKKINNPFTAIENYKCFGCSPDNPNGLQLNFTEEGNLIVSDWEPKELMQGWVNVLHGGIQATLMDEIAGWVVFVKLKTSGVTSHMDIKLKKTLYINKGSLRITGELIKMIRNIAFIKTQILNHEGELCAEGTFQYFTYPEQIAKEKLYYPGHEQFIIE